MFSSLLLQKGKLNMTHGDAMVTIGDKGTTIAAKLEALDVLVTDEHEFDYKCMRQQVMWDMLKIVYKELKKYRG